MGKAMPSPFAFLRGLIVGNIIDSFTASVLTILRVLN